MNASVLVAVISLGTMVFARLVMGGMAWMSGSVSLNAVFVQIGLAVLVLVGIVMGHRLAWQWGRILGLLAGVIFCMAALGILAHAGGRLEMLLGVVLMAMQGVPMFPMFFALGTRGARQHFRLICPQCGSTRSGAGNFLFTRATCRDCGTSWQ